MKKRLIIILITTGSIMALTADGRSNRTNNRGADKGMSEERSERMEGFLEDAEIITVSGKLILVNGEMATVTSGGVTYTIMAPWNQLMELELTDGMNVTFEGAEIQLPMQWDNKERSLMITKVTINGKTTEIDHTDRAGYMGFGGHGMMGGPGRYNN